MAQKKIEIIYDIDGKAIDVAINKTLNLQQQAKALTAELRKTKEGTEEFRLLSKNLGDVQDGLKSTTAKSRDLFGSLSLLPGPVGLFFNQLSSAVDMLKLFSSFSLKDLKFQFGEVIDDISQIGDNLSGADKETKNFTESSGELDNSLSKLSNSAGNASTSINLLENSSLTLFDNMQEAEMAVKNLNDSFRAQIDTVTDADGKITDLVISYIDADGNVQALTQAQKQNIATSKVQITTFEQLAASAETVAVAETAATLATRILTAALIGIGIGAVIIALVALFGYLYDTTKAMLGFADGTEFADEANQSLNDTLKEQQRILANDTTVLDAATKAAITRAKIAGKSEKEIYQITKDGGEERLKLLRDYDKQLFNDREKAQKDENLTREQKKQQNDKFNEEILKNGQAINAQIMANEQTRLDFELSLIGKKTTVTKQNYDEIVEREKQFRASLMALLIKDEREREVFQVNADAEKERRDVEKLKIEKKYESVRTKLLEEIEQSRKEKIKQIDKKYDNEELKARVDFNNKIKDNEIAAIENTLKRNIKAREEKYARDLKALEEDKQFAKKSEEEQSKIRKDVRQAAENDINDLIFEALIKRKTIELQALEAQQKVLIQGTQAYLDNSMQIEQNAYEIKKAQAIKNNENLVAIEAEHASNIKNIEYQSFLASKQIALERLGVIKSIGTSLQALAGKNKELAIAGIVVEKAAAIGEIIANTSIANAKAVAISPVTFGQPWVTINTIAAGLSIAATIKGAADAISQINSSGEAATETGGTQYADSSFRGYADGGIISGPGSGRSDSIQARLSNGESVINSQSTAMFAPLLSMMNQMGGGASFNLSSGTTSYDKPVDNNNNVSQIIKTYVVESDLTSAQHKQARLKDLSVL
jgi:hypothetical protein